MFTLSACATDVLRVVEQLHVQPARKDTTLMDQHAVLMCTILGFFQCALYGDVTIFPRWL